MASRSGGQRWPTDAQASFSLSHPGRSSRTRLSWRSWVARRDAAIRGCAERRRTRRGMKAGKRLTWESFPPDPSACMGNSMWGDVAHVEPDMGMSWSGWKCRQLSQLPLHLQFSGSRNRAHYGADSACCCDGETRPSRAGGYSRWAGREVRVAPPGHLPVAAAVRTGTLSLLPSSLDAFDRLVDRDPENERYVPPGQPIRPAPGGG
jgi:hypothetical protein